MNILSEISVCKEILDEDPNLLMASFDIQSLFTNIPLDEIIDISVDTVFDKKKKVKGMLKRHFKQLLILSVRPFFSMMFFTNKLIVWRWASVNC